MWTKYAKEKLMVRQYQVGLSYGLISISFHVIETLADERTLEKADFHTHDSTETHVSANNSLVLTLVVKIMMETRFTDERRQRFA